MVDLPEAITLAHGAGGAESAALMSAIFAKHFANETLLRLEDAAIVQGGERLAISTDTFVVEPLVFPGGDIGKLAVVGTINDVLMSGAVPLYLTCGFVLEAGLSIDLLDSICGSLAGAASEAGVTVIAGDTKVTEGCAKQRFPSLRDAGGLIINTTGIGIFPKGQSQFAAVPAGICPGDALILSGSLGDHHAAILAARLGIRNNIQTDCALLAPITKALSAAKIPIHAMRDVTRGGLATILNELAAASELSFMLDEKALPVSPDVRAFCGLMGLDPLYMGNEGKMVLAVSEKNAQDALAAIRTTPIGASAAIIGAVHGHPEPKDKGPLGSVFMRTSLGGTIRLDVLYGEGLPRIC